MFVNDNEFYNEFYRPQWTIEETYKNHMSSYLQKVFPDHSKEQLDQILNTIVQSRLKSPKITIVKHNFDDNSWDKKQYDLLSVANTTKTKFGFTPIGVAYRNDVENVFHEAFVIENQKERKKIKAKKLEAEVHSDITKALYYNNQQMGIKIDINAISGVMNRNIFFKSVWNYNAITSTARYSIMQGYGLIERFLGATIYLSSPDDVINYIITLLQRYPGDKLIHETLSQYPGIHIPSVDDVYNYLVEKNLKLYIINVEKKYKTSILQLLASLSQYQLFFIFYANCLWNFFDCNKHIVSKWLHELFKTKGLIIRKYLNEKPDNIVLDTTIDDLKDKELITFIAVLCAKIFNNQPLYDAIKDIRMHKIVIELYQFLSSYFTKYFGHLLENYFTVCHLTQHPTKQRHMLRRSVLISDTDSIIFTVEHFTGLFSQLQEVNSKAATIGNLVIYLTKKHFDNMFKYMSVQLGIRTKHLHRIEFKNEFYYISLIRTNLKKHYVGLVKFIEGGMCLKQPKLDIKGQMFKKSAFTAIIKDKVKDLFKHVLTESAKGNKISFFDITDTIIKLEQQVIKACENNDSTYLLSIPIKTKDQYKNGENTPSYFYYKFFMETIAKELGISSILLPEKFHKIPLKYSVTYKKLSILDPLKQSNTKLHNNIVTFLKQYPHKKINFLYMPVSVNKIPEEIRYLVDYNHIVFETCQPFYLMLASFGFPISLNDYDSNKLILSNLYTNG